MPRDSLSLGGHTPRLAPADDRREDLQDDLAEHDPLVQDASLLEKQPRRNRHHDQPPRQWAKRSGCTAVMLVAIIMLLATIAIVSNGPQVDPNWSPQAGHDEGHDHGHGMEEAHDDHGHAMEEDHHDAPDADHHDEIIQVDHDDHAEDSHAEDSHAEDSHAAPDLDQRYLLNPSWDAAAPPTRREHNWTITDVEFNPDGVYRPMMLVNGQFPGPMIEANEGDTLVIHVANHATNATALHWHGIFQNGTNHMDGAVGITQCPIAPGTSFTYEFTVKNQAGDYWWHGGHHGVQTSDGLYGPLIIHGRDEDTKAHASDRVILLADHYYDTGSELLSKYLASDRENIEPVPGHALINGRGVRDCSTLPTRKCDNTTAHVGKPRFSLEAGKSHRLRFINTGAFAEFQVAVDEHSFDVIGVDGTSVLPASYNRLRINPAQRYSVILHANKDPNTLVWLRAKMLTFCFGEDSKELEAEAFGVIQYSSAANAPAGALPTSQEWDPSVDAECRDMNTSALVPVPAIRAPAKADAQFYLRSNFEIGAWRLSRGFFNQSSFKPDLQSPSLFRAMDGLRGKNASFEAAGAAVVNDQAFDLSNEMVIQTTGIQVVDLLVSNFDDGNHPLHLHGYKFFVLAQGHGYPPANLTETVDLTNPLRRDTASVEAFGWILLRVIADNPGQWSFHCHVSFHAEAGLVMQLLTRTDELAKMQIPQAARDLCAAPRAELEKGARPGDDLWVGNFEVAGDD